VREDPGRTARVVAAFAERFGGEPSVGCRAPGRVDLMGSHTDYNLGLVLTLPLGRDTWIVGRPRPDRSVHVHSLNLEEGCVLDLDDLVPSTSRHWRDYVGGVAAVLQAEGLSLRGWDGVVHSTVPMGSGLSSSAALECAVATVFEVLGGWRIEPVRKAQLCQRAENEFVGVRCGILDQYTACAGQEGCALLLDCRDLTALPVGLPDDIRVVICDTRSRRELAGSEYGTRRAQCEEGARRLGVAALREVTMGQLGAREGELPPEVARRCRFIVEENERVQRLARALPAGDRRVIREACASSFHGAMELYEIGAPAMERMMAAMTAAPGVIGARQAGAGFGGCMVAFVNAEHAGPFAATVHATYAAATGVEPAIDPVWPGAGAGVIPSHEPGVPSSPRGLDAARFSGPRRG
jgi:galactokinase